ncbi:hypothetical protein CBR_g22984 [Chara braunii]|uniref:Inner centromere protein ARK-binding domain-containing protein n=1 Tax=Chara braunii TaxID=69332 RepID=A0A388L3D8_CHABU|nr:hypothetical protein CBR_g22984 [Chara braunii]|eukprot:GBG76768.1 hypothetical protein CBR_g22984 [Chara braunii]
MEVLWKVLWKARNKATYLQTREDNLPAQVGELMSCCDKLLESVPGMFEASLKRARTGGNLKFGLECDIPKAKRPCARTSKNALPDGGKRNAQRRRCKEEKMPAALAVEHRPPHSFADSVFNSVRSSTGVGEEKVLSASGGEATAVGLSNLTVGAGLVGADGCVKGREEGVIVGGSGKEERAAGATDSMVIVLDDEDDERKPGADTGSRKGGSDAEEASLSQLKGFPQGQNVGLSTSPECEEPARAVETSARGRGRARKASDRKERAESSRRGHSQRRQPRGEALAAAADEEEDDRSEGRQTKSSCRGKPALVIQEAQAQRTRSCRGKASSPPEPGVESTQDRRNQQEESSQARRTRSSCRERISPFNPGEENAQARRTRSSSRGGKPVQEEASSQAQRTRSSCRGKASSPPEPGEENTQDRRNQQEASSQARRTRSSCRERTSPSDPGAENAQARRTRSASRGKPSPADADDESTQGQRTRSSSRGKPSGERHAEAGELPEEEGDRRTAPRVPLSVLPVNLPRKPGGRGALGRAKRGKKSDECTTEEEAADGGSANSNAPKGRKTTSGSSPAATGSAGERVPDKDVAPQVQHDAARGDDVPTMSSSLGAKTMSNKASEAEEHPEANLHPILKEHPTPKDRPSPKDYPEPKVNPEPQVVNHEPKDHPQPNYLPDILEELPDLKEQPDLEEQPQPDLEEQPQHDLEEQSQPDLEEQPQPDLEEQPTRGEKDELDEKSNLEEQPDLEEKLGVDEKHEVEEKPNREEIAQPEEKADPDKEAEPEVIIPAAREEHAGLQKKAEPNDQREPKEDSGPGTEHAEYLEVKELLLPEAKEPFEGEERAAEIALLAEVKGNEIGSAGGSSAEKASKQSCSSSDCPAQVDVIVGHSPPCSRVGGPGKKTGGGRGSRRRAGKSVKMAASCRGRASANVTSASGMCGGKVDGEAEDKSEQDVHLSHDGSSGVVVVAGAEDRERPVGDTEGPVGDTEGPVGDADGPVCDIEADDSSAVGAKMAGYKACIFQVQRRSDEDGRVVPKESSMIFQLMQQLPACQIGSAAFERDSEPGVGNAYTHLQLTQQQSTTTWERRSDSPERVCERVRDVRSADVLLPKGSQDDAAGSSIEEKQPKGGNEDLVRADAEGKRRCSSPDLVGQVDGIVKQSPVCSAEADGDGKESSGGNGRGGRRRATAGQTTGLCRVRSAAEICGGRRDDGRQSDRSKEYAAAVESSNDRCGQEALLPEGSEREAGGSAAADNDMAAVVSQLAANASKRTAFQAEKRSVEEDTCLLVKDCTPVSQLMQQVAMHAAALECDEVTGHLCCGSVSEGRVENSDIRPDVVVSVTKEELSDGERRGRRLGEATASKEQEEERGIEEKSEHYYIVVEVPTDRMDDNDRGQFDNAAAVQTAVQAVQPGQLDNSAAKCIGSQMLMAYRTGRGSEPSSSATPAPIMESVKEGVQAGEEKGGMADGTDQVTFMIDDAVSSDECMATSAGNGRLSGRLLEASNSVRLGEKTDGRSSVSSTMKIQHNRWHDLVEVSDAKLDGEEKGEGRRRRRSGCEGEENLAATPDVVTVIMPPTRASEQIATLLPLTTASGRPLRSASNRTELVACIRSSVQEMEDAEGKMEAEGQIEDKIGEKINVFLPLRTAGRAKAQGEEKIARERVAEGQIEDKNGEKTDGLRLKAKEAAQIEEIAGERVVILPSRRTGRRAPCAGSGATGPVGEELKKVEMEGQMEKDEKGEKTRVLPLRATGRAKAQVERERVETLESRRTGRRAPCAASGAAGVVGEELKKVEMEGQMEKDEKGEKTSVLPLRATGRAKAQIEEVERERVEILPLRRTGRRPPCATTAAAAGEVGEGLKAEIQRQVVGETVEPLPLRRSGRIRMPAQSSAEGVSCGRPGDECSPITVSMVQGKTGQPIEGVIRVPTGAGQKTQQYEEELSKSVFPRSSWTVAACSARTALSQAEESERGGGADGKLEVGGGEDNGQEQENDGGVKNDKLEAGGETKEHEEEEEEEIEKDGKKTEALPLRRTGRAKKRQTEETVGLVERLEVLVPLTTKTGRRLPSATTGPAGEVSREPPKAETERETAEKPEPLPLRRSGRIRMSNAQTKAEPTASKGQQDAGHDSSPNVTLAEAKVATQPERMTSTSLNAHTPPCGPRMSKAVLLPSTMIGHCPGRSVCSDEGGSRVGAAANGTHVEGGDVGASSSPPDGERRKALGGQPGATDDDENRAAGCGGNSGGREERSRGRWKSDCGAGGESNVLPPLPRSRTGQLRGGKVGSTSRNPCPGLVGNVGTQYSAVEKDEELKAIKLLRPLEEEDETGGRRRREAAPAGCESTAAAEDSRKAGSSPDGRAAEGVVLQARSGWREVGRASSCSNAVIITAGALVAEEAGVGARMPASAAQETNESEYVLLSRDPSLKTEREKAGPLRRVKESVVEWEGEVEKERRAVPVAAERFGDDDDLMGDQVSFASFVAPGCRLKKKPNGEKRCSPRAGNGNGAQCIACWCPPLVIVGEEGSVAGSVDLSVAVESSIDYMEVCSPSFSSPRGDRLGGGVLERRELTEECELRGGNVGRRGEECASTARKATRQPREGSPRRLLEEEEEEEDKASGSRTGRNVNDNPSTNGDRWKEMRPCNAEVERGGERGEEPSCEALLVGDLEKKRARRSSARWKKVSGGSLKKKIVAEEATKKTMDAELACDADDERTTGRRRASGDPVLRLDVAAGAAENAGNNDSVGEAGSCRSKSCRSTSRKARALSTRAKHPSSLPVQASDDAEANEEGAEEPKVLPAGARQSDAQEDGSRRESPPLNDVEREGSEEQRRRAQQQSSERRGKPVAEVLRTGARQSDAQDDGITEESPLLNDVQRRERVEGRRPAQRSSEARGKPVVETPIASVGGGKALAATDVDVACDLENERVGGGRAADGDPRSSFEEEVAAGGEHDGKDSVVEVAEWRGRSSRSASRRKGRSLSSRAKHQSLRVEPSDNDAAEANVGATDPKLSRSGMRQSNAGEDQIEEVSHVIEGLEGKQRWEEQRCNRRSSSAAAGKEKANDGSPMKTVVVEELLTATTVGELASSDREEGGPARVKGAPHNGVFVVDLTGGVEKDGEDSPREVGTTARSSRSASSRKGRSHSSRGKLSSSQDEPPLHAEPIMASGDAENVPPAGVRRSEADLDSNRMDELSPVTDSHQVCDERKPSQRCLLAEPAAGEAAAGNVHRTGHEGYSTDEMMEGGGESNDGDDACTAEDYGQTDRPRLCASAENEDEIVVVDEGEDGMSGSEGKSTSKRMDAKGEGKKKAGDDGCTLLPLPSLSVLNHTPSNLCTSVASFLNRPKAVQALQATCIPVVTAATEKTGSSYCAPGGGSAKDVLTTSLAEQRESDNVNICASVYSFLPVVAKPPPPVPGVPCGKRNVKVKALEAAEEARREEEKKAEERRVRKEMVANATAQKCVRGDDANVDRSGKRGKANKKGKMGAAPSVPREEDEEVKVVESRLKRVQEVCTKVKLESEKKAAEDRRRLEEDRARKEMEIALKKKAKEEADKREREEKRRRQEEAKNVRKEAEERQRMEYEEKERKRKAQEEAERERKAAAEEAKRQRRMEKAMEVERRKKEKEEETAAKWEADRREAERKEAERRRATESHMKRKELESERSYDRIHKAPRVAEQRSACMGLLVAVGSSGGSGAGVRRGTASDASLGQPLSPGMSKVRSRPGGSSTALHTACNYFGPSGTLTQALASLNSAANVSTSVASPSLGRLKKVKADNSKLTGTGAKQVAFAVVTVNSAGVSSPLRCRPSQSAASTPPPPRVLAPLNVNVPKNSNPGAGDMKDVKEVMTRSYAGSAVAPSSEQPARAEAAEAARVDVSTGDVSAASWGGGIVKSANHAEAHFSAVQKSAGSQAAAVTGLAIGKGLSDARPGAPETRMPVRASEEAVQSYEISPYRASDSDSEEDQPSSKCIPLWARRENLSQSLHAQVSVDPDHIFPAVETCSLEDVFKDDGKKHRKYNKRKSSGNWLHDRLTTSEVISYKKGMGYL